MNLRNLSMSAAIYLYSGYAMASTTTKLPWEGPLEILQRSLTGPVAFAISLIALVICGWALIAGGEMSDFARRSIMVVLAISLLVSGSKIMTELFGISAALV